MSTVPYPLNAHATGDRLLQLYADNWLFLSGTNLAQFASHSDTKLVCERHAKSGGSYCNMLPLVPLYPKLQTVLVHVRKLDHAIFYQALLNEPLTRLAIQCLPDLDALISYEQKQSQELRTPTSSSAEEQWDQLKQTMHSAADPVCSLRSDVHRRP